MYISMSYFCGMVKKGMDHREAYADFRKWLPTQLIWLEIPRGQKQYIYVADRAYDKGTLGIHRVHTILNRYAPGRYEFLVLLREAQDGDSGDK